MNTLLQDIRYALRQLRRAPGYAFAVVLTLALSVGVATAVFCVIDAVILRPLPLRTRARLSRCRPPPAPGTTAVLLGKLSRRARAGAHLRCFCRLQRLQKDHRRQRPPLAPWPSIACAPPIISSSVRRPAAAGAHLPAGEQEDGKMRSRCSATTRGSSISTATVPSSANRSSWTAAPSPLSALCPPGSAIRSTCTAPFIFRACSTRADEQPRCALAAHGRARQGRRDDRSGAGRSGARLQRSCKAYPNTDGGRVAKALPLAESVAGKTRARFGLCWARCWPFSPSVA